MANVHAAIKQIRKDSRKRKQNQAATSELKTLWTNLVHLPQGDTAKAKSWAQNLISKWDRAVSRGVVPKGRADRKKTRIAHFFTRFSQSH